MYPNKNLLKRIFERTMLLCLLILTTQDLAAQDLFATGRVMVPDGIMSDTRVEMLAPDGTISEVPVKWGNKFKVELSQKGRYQLLYHRPGCRSKLVELDTRSVRVREKRKVIQFDVVLQVQDDQEKGTELHKAGRLGFHSSNGRMLVQYLEFEDRDTVHLAERTVLDKP